MITKRLRALILLVGLAVSSKGVVFAQNGLDRLHEPFAHVSQEAGISAAHRGEWDQFHPDFSSGYLGVGQAWGDYNNDGWLDLYVTGNIEDNVLYRNNGDGTFSVSEYSDSVSMPGVLTGGTLWGDYDNDGWLDLYVVAYGMNALFHNDQGQGFTDVTQEAGIQHTGKGTSATWGDYNGDSYLDLYVGNWSCFPECGDAETADHTLAQDVLYRNNGDGTFTDVSHLLVYEKLLGSAFAASFVDYDNDGDVDIYVVNDMLINPIGNVLWRNDGAGCGEWCWTDASVEANADTRTYAMGLAIGDYDNNHYLDFYFTNIVNRMTMLHNQGDGTFVDATRPSRTGIGPTNTGVVAWGAVFFDYNNDGWPDLYVAATEFRLHKHRTPTGLPAAPETLMAPHPDYLFRNNGDSTFVDVTPNSWRWEAQATLGVAYADYDHDGWVDFVVGEWNEGYALFRNTGAEFYDADWLTLRLVGGGDVNRDAVGTRVYLTTDDDRTQMQAVISGSSLGAGNDLALHFGLGDSSVKRLRVVWPDGTERLLEDITANQILQITYPDTARTLFVGERPQ